VIHVLSNWCRRASRKFTAPAASSLEPLEGRVLLSSGPGVATITADNRGQIVMNMTAAVKPATVNANTARILTAGPDGLLNTPDDTPVPTFIQVSGKTIYLTANTPANVNYRVQLLSGTKGVKGTNGKKLIGNSGAGGIGGNFDDTTVGANFIARFRTVAGDMNVTLDGNTPITNQNFLNYANSGAWDGTFFHRNAVDPNTGAKSHFIIQGGGFRVVNDQFDFVPDLGPILNEPVNHNERGTIAMAKLGSDPNSATNQFFFNLGDNIANLDQQNGGFTAFGELDAAGLVVMDALDNNFPVGNVTQNSQFLTSVNTTPAALNDPQNRFVGALNEMPLINISTITNTGKLDPNRDAVIIFRVAMQMNILPSITTGVSPATAHPAAAAAAAPVVPPAAAAPASPAATAGNSLFSTKDDPSLWA
jgi:cyclophilin family peptidyl-prolyl cis-trans isomerase